MPNRLVNRIHFEDFGGVEFERLTFAYHVRAAWSDLAWYGQTGSDLGRDIIGLEPLVEGPSRRTVIQCVNRSELTFKKAEHDMANAVSAPSGAPDAFKFVSRGNVSAALRDAITRTSIALGIGHIAVWSGVEFEENLRLAAEDLLRRFCDGEAFPDKADEIRQFADDFPRLSDDEALQMMAAVFDRPAFWTPFRDEVSLPAFRQALEDTISALSTGVWRTRDGAEIRRIPSVHNLRDPKNKATIAAAIQCVDRVRHVFVSALKDGSIRHCACDDPDCPVFFFSDTAAEQLDGARRLALETFAKACPGSRVRRFLNHVWREGP